MKKEIFEPKIVKTHDDGSVSVRRMGHLALFTFNDGHAVRSAGENFDGEEEIPAASLTIMRRFAEKYMEEMKNAA